MISKKLKLTDRKLYEKYKKYIENYAPVTDYIKEQRLKKATEDKHISGFALYCCSQDEELGALLEEAKKEEKEDTSIEEKQINERFNRFEEYLSNENYADRTIRSHKKTIRAFYRRNGISLPVDDQRTLMNPEIRNHIKESEVFQNFVDELNLENEGTIGGYLTSLTGYCEFFNMTIEELIDEADDEEERKVRKSKRKLKNRLIKYRKHLYEKYANSTISTKMSDITYFYVINGIEIPDMPRPNEPYEPELSYKEIPTINHVKRAVETTTSIKNRALFLFCMTSGASSAEAREFSVKEYLEGTEKYHGEKTDIKRALEKMDGKTDIVPVFHLVRVKKKKDYYSAITPEANQFIINYLKERENLSLEDKVFDYSRKGVTNAFQYVNDTNNWGWVKNNRQRFFTCHQMRRLNANIIDDVRLVHMIQGKKFDATVEAYFKRDPEKIRKKYLKYIPSLTIYEKFKTIWLTDEEYNKLAKEIKEKDEHIKEIEERNKEQAELIEQLQEQTTKIETEVDAKIEQKVEDIKKDLLSDLAPNELRPNKIRNKIITHLHNDSVRVEKEDLPLIVELATNLALRHEEIWNEGKGIKEIVGKAKIELKIDQTLKKNLRKNVEEDYRVDKHMESIHEYVMKYAKENDLVDGIGGEYPEAKLIGYLLDNKEKYAKSEINEKLASEVLKGVMYYDDVEYY